MNDFGLLEQRGWQCHRFDVRFGQRIIRPVLASPGQADLSADPILLVAVEGRPDICFLQTPPNIPVFTCLERGHRVITFDTIGPESLKPIHDAVVHGPDPFVDFIDQAGAVIDECIRKNRAQPKRIVACGTSRFAYFAMRLLAADDRIVAAAGFAPVTDWRDLSEFDHCRHRKEIADLRLSNFVNRLAGRRIYLAVGNHDERVNTRRCCQFFLDLNHENQKRGFGASCVDFFCTADHDHTCGEEWIRRGIDFLLTTAGTPDGSPRVHR